MHYKPNINNKCIGLRMRQEREKLGLSREQFAEMLNLSNYYVGQLERGERQMSLPVLIKIADCLHISLDYLIYGKHCDNLCVVNSNTSNQPNNSTIEEINDLLKKCSNIELDLLKKIISTLIPYLTSNR